MINLRDEGSAEGPATIETRLGELEGKLYRVNAIFYGSFPQAKDEEKNPRLSDRLNELLSKCEQLVDTIEIAVKTIG